MVEDLDTKYHDGKTDLGDVLGRASKDISGRSALLKV
jgi:hypothetical protein